jgi:hypothetical protein
MSDVATPTEQPPYDYTPLLQLYERAAIILRSEGQGRDRFTAAARALCDFYNRVSSDQAFWDETARLANEGNTQRPALLANVADFEQDEYELLVKAGVEELRASELAGNLAVYLRQYGEGAVLDLSQLRTAVDSLRDEVCKAEANIPKDAKGWRSRLKRLSQAANVAGIIVGIAVNIASHGVASVVAGALAGSSAVTDAALGDGHGDG